MQKDEACDLFRSNMKAIRQELGFSQSELARRMGVYPSYVCDLENVRRPGLTLGTIADIAEALGVSISTLLSTVRSPLAEVSGQR